MSIRITGMYSGLDTESIITELASAQSAKLNSLVKAQTKLSWKKEAWKTLNTQVYSFYTGSLDSMRFESSYMSKVTKVSNTAAVSVAASSSAVNGVQTMKIGQMAKTAYLTGANISGTNNGSDCTSSTKLSDLLGEDFTGGSISVVMGDGTSVDISVNGSTTISSFVSSLKSAGLNASFDETNQRFFVSSSETGAAANFELVANDEGGMNALAAFGLLTDTATDTYQAYLDSYYDEATGTFNAAGQAMIDADIASTAASYAAKNEQLSATLADAQAAYAEAYGDTTVTEDDLQTLSDTLADKQTALDSAQADVTTWEDAVAEAEANLAALGEEDEGYAEAQQALADAQAALDSANEAYEAAQEDYNSASDDYDAANTQYEAAQNIADLQAQIADNAQYYEETVGEDGETVISGSQLLTDQIQAQYDAKLATAIDVVQNGLSVSDGATKINGQDAVIYLNGAEFTSSTNDFSINGLTISVLQETDEEITLTTSQDTDGIYDMIKSFFSDYNSLINEMDSLYNADANSDYSPLTSEEKDAMSDKEIEEWEQKVKDSLLRKDSTLSTLSSALKQVLSAGYTVNGVTMYLSDFGINTLSYFSSADNEKNAYHIDGDTSDGNSTVSTADDVLRSMIASDPDTVVSFFTQLANALHDTLSDQMASSSSSSAFTVYDDKSMDDEYDDYTDKIAKQQEKLDNLIDKWYDKFSAMETALAQLESKSSALSSLLGS